MKLNKIVHYKNNVINELNVTSIFGKCITEWKFSNPTKKKIIEKSCGRPLRQK